MEHMKNAIVFALVSVKLFVFRLLLGIVIRQMILCELFYVARFIFFSILWQAINVAVYVHLGPNGFSPYTTMIGKPFSKHNIKPKSLNPSIQVLPLTFGVIFSNRQSFSNYFEV